MAIFSFLDFTADFMALLHRGGYNAKWDTEEYNYIKILEIWVSYGNFCSDAFQSSVCGVP